MVVVLQHKPFTAKQAKPQIARQLAKASFAAADWFQLIMSIRARKMTMNQRIMDWSLDGGDGQCRRPIEGWDCGACRY
jgi:hypothetical protein